MGKNKEPDIKDLPLIGNFREARGLLEQSILTSDSLKGRANICLHVAQLYKTIAENTQEKGMKRLASEEAQYFLTEAFKFKKQYEMQEIMLPEQFDVDKPI